MEENIGEILTFYRLPSTRHEHMKSTDMLERLNEEIKRRTRVVRIFPSVQSCLHLMKALTAETHEALAGRCPISQYGLLKEQKKELLRMAGVKQNNTTHAQPHLRDLAYTTKKFTVGF